MKRFKKVLPLCLLALVLVISITLLTPKAEATTVESGTCGDNLTWVLDDDGTLTISGIGAMYNWEKYDGAPWYSNSASIHSVVIQPGVTTIGVYAFDYCDSLENVTIPDSVTSIGSAAFCFCDNLRSITIPDGVTTIGEGAFSCCASLQRVNIGNSVTYIGEGAFEDCTTLESVIIPDSVIDVDSSAFRSCTSLQRVTIGNSVTYIGNCVFAYCDNLQRVTIGNSVTLIGEDAFYYCQNLQSITIPASVTAIDYYAFYGCYNLEDVYYAGTQSQWNAILNEDGNSCFNNATIHYNHTHNYTLIAPVTVEPTCTANGYIEYTCMYGDIFREVIPALGHSVGIDAVVIAPTCTERGYTQSICTLCGVTGKTDYTDALGHDYTGPEVTVGATCTQEGYSGASCTRCDAINKGQMLEVLGHNVVVIQLRDATCTEQGVSKVGTMCDRCQEMFIQPTYTPALGHNYEEGVCTVCQAKDPDYVPPIPPGDINCDYATDNSDVLTLLWHTLFEEDNPIKVSGDLNGDKYVDNKDVLLLLWHTLFPDEYPL